MKTKILLLFTAILMSLSLQAQNSIAIVNPPASVEGNTYVDITFDYTLAEVGHAFIRFKNADGNVTASPVYDLPAGSGTLTVSLEIPRSFNGEELPLDNSYSYQAQLFNSNYSATLASVDYNGVTLTAAANYIELTTYPTTVNEGSYVDITFDYASDKEPTLYAFIRVHDASGTQLSDTGAIALSTASGTVTHSVEIEVPIGTDYEYRILLFHPSNWGSALATDNVPGITVEEAVAPANSIEWVGPPTIVAAGSDANITFNYVTDVANAHIFIRFKDDLFAEGITNVNQIVSAGSGTLTLPLPIPTDKDGSPLPLGLGYLYQAQIFDVDAGYSHVLSENFEGVSLEAAPANTVAINSVPNPVLISSEQDITVSYTKDIAEDLFVVLRILDGAGNELVAEYGQAMGASGDIAMSITIPETEAEDYSFNVQLLDVTSAVMYEKTYRGIVAATSLSAEDFKSKFKNLSVYPNPFNDSFSYKFDDNVSDPASVEIYTIDGRKIKTVTSENRSYGNIGTVNTSQLSRGLYLVRITSGELQGTRKLIKN
ncbi:T9SS type A sorting domain-containing protein [Algibacter sp. AS12]|uniref:T9SS type A sorting domain-containing protein n=1 Tax=Algibacter sp. AS12 TaxID=3135773 RepID=UPI00398AFE2D